MSIFDSVPYHLRCEYCKEPATVGRKCFRHYVIILAYRSRRLWAYKWFRVHQEYIIQMLRGRFALIKATGVIPDIIPFVPTLFTKQPKPLWLKYYPEDRRKIEVGGHDTRRLFLSLLDKIDKKALKEYKRENHTSNETD